MDVVAYDEDMVVLERRYRVQSEDAERVQWELWGMYPDALAIEVEPHDDDAERRELLEIPDFMRRTKP